MAVRKKLLIIESIISITEKTERTVLLDLMMLVGLSSGKKCTETEFTQLLQANGFKLNRIINTALDISIIEAESI
jgi:hypothetical protein